MEIKVGPLTAVIVATLSLLRVQLFMLFVSLYYSACLFSHFFLSSGYNIVVRIPAGATNIDIKQVSYSGKPEDDNYLGEYTLCVCVSARMLF